MIHRLKDNTEPELFEKMMTKRLLEFMENELLGQ